MAENKSVQVNAGQSNDAQVAENAKRDDYKPHIPNEKSPQNMEHVQAVAEKLDQDKLLRSADSIRDEHDTGENLSADALVQSTKDAEAEEMLKHKEAVMKDAGVDTDSTDTDVSGTGSKDALSKSKYDDGDSDMTDKTKPAKPGKQAPGKDDKGFPGKPAA